LGAGLLGACLPGNGGVSWGSYTEGLDSRQGRFDDGRSGGRKVGRFCGGRDGGRSSHGM
ncbi:hypothetical protein Tco_1298706, partial [Tanacetum coccineum]